MVHVAIMDQAAITDRDDIMEEDTITDRDSLMEGVSGSDRDGARGGVLDGALRTIPIHTIPIPLTPTIRRRLSVTSSSRRSM
jgi:hypothetical protein